MPFGRFDAPLQRLFVAHEQEPPLGQASRHLANQRPVISLREPADRTHGWPFGRALGLRVDERLVNAMWKVKDRRRASGILRAEPLCLIGGTTKNGPGPPGEGLFGGGSRRAVVVIVQINQP